MTPEEFYRIISKVDISDPDTTRISCSGVDFDNRVRHTVRHTFHELIMDQHKQWHVVVWTKRHRNYIPFSIDIIEDEDELLKLIRVICAMGG